MPVEKPEAELAKSIATRIGVRADDILRWKVLRKSLDARKRNQLQFVYSAFVEVNDDVRPKVHTGGDIDEFKGKLFFRSHNPAHRRWEIDRLSLDPDRPDCWPLITWQPKDTGR